MAGHRRRRGHRGRHQMRPPAATDVDSVVPLANGLLVSAQDESGTFNLWFFNNLTQSWIMVLESDDDLIEVDWVP